MIRTRSPDVLVVGDGLIGLASALALADAGARVLLVGSTEPGQASYAAAGMLAPSAEAHGSEAARAFGLLARGRYRTYVEELEQRTGERVPLALNGLLEVALDDADAHALSAQVTADSTWLGRDEVVQLEPALAHVVGALFHPDDGAVDNRRLLLALARAVGQHEAVTWRRERAVALEWEAQAPVLVTARNERLTGDGVVVAAGAWLERLNGLPRALPVKPVRGQILAVAARPLDRVVYGPGGYLVPRGSHTLLGSTMEHVGFDDATTDDGIAGVRRAGERICPALCNAPEAERWAGLRPLTPDGLPVLGHDPERPALVWAVGHSRNGVLLAPLTGDCVAALALGRTPPADLAPFAPTRFAGG